VSRHHDEQTRQGNGLASTSVTELIGRDAELHRVQALLDAGARIVTLWGPAGVGKTRLARACARAPVGFDASWFVDLSAAVDWAGVVAAVSGAIGAIMQPASVERVAEQIGRALAARGRVLVVLDNFEQVVADAAANLGRWSAVAVDATFLVTSRETLGLGDEVVYEVPALTAEAACELFAVRALAAGRAVAPEDGPLVRHIVNQLDCLPLTVELAAAQVPLLGVAELRSRLTQLALLDSGRRDVDDRQRTVRGALNWSWRLLSGAEQRALAQCSVFHGGFTIAAAEATLIGEPLALPTVAVLRTLHRRSLVQSRVTDGGEVRCSLLFAVRELAAEHLARDPRLGDGAELRARHATYFAHVAERWAARAAGPDGKEMLRQLAIERDNLLSAHAYAAAGDPRLAIRLALALAPLLLAHGPLDRLRQLIDEALRAAGPHEDSLLGTALVTRALAARRLGDASGAIADFDRALELARRIGDPGLEARALCERGRWAAEQSQCPAAVVYLEAALALAVTAGDRAIEAEVLTNLGYAMWYDGKLASAEALYRRALPLAQAEQNVALEGRIVDHISALAYERGDLDAFIVATHVARRLALQAGDQRHVAMLTMGLALGAAEQGRADEADQLFAECLAGLRAAGDVVGEGHCLANVGWEEMRARRGLGRAHFERALTLLEGAHIGWADGLVRATLAAVAAMEDRIDDARDLIAQAERHMETVTDPRLHDTARLHYAHLEVALARRAEAHGDEPLAARLRAAVRALLEREPTDPDAGRSDARLARLILERALAGSVIEAPPAPPASPSLFDDVLLIAPDAAGFRPPGGAWVDLSRRKPLRRILMALAAGKILTTEDVLRAGWPGESVMPQAGAARVHVAIATLRRLGLGPALSRGPTGYCLDPRIPIRSAIPAATQASQHP
jgi:predicted ATPase